MPKGLCDAFTVAVRCECEPAEWMGKSGWDIVFNLAFKGCRDVVGVRGIRGIFFRGAKSFFLIFFLVENFHFGRHKTIFSGFENKVLCSFSCFFTHPFRIFHLPFYNFPSFLSISLFSLPLFYRKVSKNFPVKSAPPPATPLVGVFGIRRMTVFSYLVILTPIMHCRSVEIMMGLGERGVYFEKENV